jgi:hypothetical protein
VLDEAEPHLDRLEASLAADLRDHPETRVEDEPSRTTAVIEVESKDATPVPPRRVRRTSRRGHGRRSRVAAAVTVVAVLLAVTGLYVRTQADAADKRARRPTSTSLEKRSTSTTGAPASVEVAPGTEPGPASVAVPGSQADAPQGTRPAPSRGNAPRPPPSASYAPAPGSTGAPQSNAAPPSAPPRNPMCQLLPALCL